MTEKTTRPPRQFAIRLSGYCTEIFPGETKAQARYAAFRQFCDAVTKISFRDFVGRIDAIHEVKS